MSRGKFCSVFYQALNIIGSILIQVPQPSAIRKQFLKDYSEFILQIIQITKTVTALLTLLNVGVHAHVFQ